MAYDSTKPANDGFLADFPPEMREQLRAIIQDAIVNAGLLNGLKSGNAQGQIPVSNGNLNTGLNAEKLGGNLASAFAPAGHSHSTATGSSNGFMSNTDKTKLDGVATGAQVNQNAFSNVLVGSTTVQADSPTDTLEFVAGTNIALTPDTTNDRVTISVSGKVSSATTADTAATCTGNAATATNATNHISAVSNAHTASVISSTVTGNISATNVQAAIAELEAEKQPRDNTLTALAALSTAADKIIYATGSDTFATTALTAFARTLLDDTDAATARNTLGAASLVSPALTGTPTAPTAAAGTNNTQLATTAFVQTLLSTSGGGIVASSFAENGYVKFANGFIVQWGTIVSDGTWQTWTFPVQMSNTKYKVVSGLCTVPSQTAGALGTPTFKNKTINNITVGLTSGNANWSTDIFIIGWM